MEIKGLRENQARFFITFGRRWMNKMMRRRNPFPLLIVSRRKLQPLVSLWETLRHGENGMPFSDDLGVPAPVQFARKSVLAERFRRPSATVANF